MRLPPVRFSEVGAFRHPGDDDGVPRLPPGLTMPSGMPWKDRRLSDPAQRSEPGFQGDKVVGLGRDRRTREQAGELLAATPDRRRSS